MWNSCHILSRFVNFLYEKNFKEFLFVVLLFVFVIFKTIPGEEGVRTAGVEIRRPTFDTVPVGPLSIRM
jgi:hypothetical protein